MGIVKTFKDWTTNAAKSLKKRCAQRLRPLRSVDPKRDRNGRLLTRKGEDEDIV